MSRLSPGSGSFRWGESPIGFLKDNPTMEKIKLLYKVEDEDPNRCQSLSIKGDQCSFKSVKALIEEGILEGFDPKDAQNAVSCPQHNGFASVRSYQKKRLHSYRLQIWQERIEEFAEAEDVKNLRGEIAIVRLMIETIINQCQGNETQLIVYSQRLGDLIRKCESLVRSCDRLETNMGMMLDKTQALTFGSKVVEIISRHINDPEVLDQISGDIITALGEN